MRHFQFDKKSSFMQNLHNVFKMQKQQRFYRCVKNENLSFNIDQLIYIHQHH